jgi:hypothetical protein
MPILWVLGGRLIFDWSDAGTLRAHDEDAIVVVLLNVAAPLVVGLAGGLLIDWLGGQTQLAKVIGWTGIFEPPTAWEKTWLLVQSGAWAAVRVQLDGGEEFNVLSDKTSKVGLAPGPRYLFFRTEYHEEDDGELQIEEHQGIFIDATEVVSVRIEHIALEEPH